MLKVLNKRLRHLCSRFTWSIRRRSKPRIVIKQLEKAPSKSHLPSKNEPIVNGSATVHPNDCSRALNSEKKIRLATFNAALFSMAPAVPKAEEDSGFGDGGEDFGKDNRVFDGRLRAKSHNDRPKGILKQSPMHPNSTENFSRQKKFAKSKLRVSINLPDNEISLVRNRQLSFDEREGSSGGNGSLSRVLREKEVLRERSKSSVVEVLRELDADIVALQDVKAEEEKSMKPLSDLAAALGMNYVFAESWAPEYGNAVLSKWPIKRWKVQKIFDETDFRNALKATVDIPHAGEVDFYCTHLDHLNENWRMKQINAIIQSSDVPHILVGGLNSLDETDYSLERWTDIVNYYEEMGKPTPKVEVMKFLKSKQYIDAKDFAGECESVVVIAKGQSVQGTCKYGTRVDYILTSPNLPFKFIPGSYSVCSSKGTSDHHIVKVDMMKVTSKGEDNHINEKTRQLKQKVVKITSSSSSKGIWNIQTSKQQR